MEKLKYSKEQIVCYLSAIAASAPLLHASRKLGKFPQTRAVQLCVGTEQEAKSGGKNAGQPCHRLYADQCMTASDVKITATRQKGLLAKNTGLYSV